MKALKNKKKKNMRISRQIGNSHIEQMNLILEFILTFDVNKLLYAINGKQLNEDEIRSLTLDISEQNLKLEQQKNYLFNFGKHSIKSLPQMTISVLILPLSCQEGYEVERRESSV